MAASIIRRPCLTVEAATELLRKLTAIDGPEALSQQESKGWETRQSRLKCEADAIAGNQSGVDGHVLTSRRELGPREGRGSVSAEGI